MSTTAPESAVLALTVVTLTEFGTVSVYDNFPGSNAGESVTFDRFRLDRLASADAVDVARVTVTVYVFVAIASAASTFIVMTFAPSAKSTEAVNIRYFGSMSRTISSSMSDVTITLASTVSAVAVNARVLPRMVYGTLAVYAVLSESYDGPSETSAVSPVNANPVLATNLASSEASSAARVTTTVYVFVVNSRPPL